MAVSIPFFIPTQHKQHSNRFNCSQAAAATTTEEEYIIKIIHEYSASSHQQATSDKRQRKPSKQAVRQADALVMCKYLHTCRRPAAEGDNSKPTDTIKHTHTHTHNS